LLARILKLKKSITISLFIVTVFGGAYWSYQSNKKKLALANDQIETLVETIELAKIKNETARKDLDKRRDIITNLSNELTDLNTRLRLTESRLTTMLDDIKTTDDLPAAQIIIQKELNTSYQCVVDAMQPEGEMVCE